MDDPISKRDPDQTRTRILDAALNIFASKGYYNTRMDEIVDESHTSKGSIYFHFPNKERLFLALVDQFADLLERRVTEAIQQEEVGINRVRVALETCLTTFGKYRRPAKLLLVQAVIGQCLGFGLAKAVVFWRLDWQGYGRDEIDKVAATLTASILAILALPAAGNGAAS